MYENLLNLLKVVKDTNINKDYIYINDETEFIFQNLSDSKIIGVNNILKYKVISVLDEKIKNDIMYIKIKIDSETTGWIEKGDSIRAYRLPKINGKITEEIDYNLSFYKSKVKINNLINKIVKAYYYFNYKGEDYLLIARIGSENYIPVKMIDFHRLISVSESFYVKLESDELLYLTSNFTNVESKLETEGSYRIHSYFKGLASMRIENGNQKYWIKHDTSFLETDNFNFDASQLELMDYITYLIVKNQELENKNKNNTNILDNLRKEIVVDNEEQQLFLNKYIGDQNVIK